MSSTRSALSHLQEISKTVDQLKQKLKQKNKNSIDDSDLHILKELCISDDPKISSVSCEVVVDLVKSNLFPLSKAFTWFISMLQTGLGSNTKRIVQIIADLILLNDEINFNMHSPQHPFILVLKQNAQYWNDVVFHMNHILKSEHDANRQRIFLTFMPLLKYVLWSLAGTSALCKRGAWKFFIDNFRTEDMHFLVQTICWLPSRDNDSIVDVDHFLNDYEKFNRIINENNFQDAMSVYYAYVGCKLAEYGYNPANTLQICKTILYEYPRTINMILVLVAQTIVDCPARYVDTLLRFCIELIEDSKCVKITVLWLLVGSILPWLIHPLSYLEDVCKTSERLFAILENHPKAETRNLSHLQFDENFMQIVNSEREMYWAFVVVKALENSNYLQLLNKADKLDVKNEEARKHIILQLSFTAILLSSEDPDIQIKALNISMNINAGFQLPVILYLLAKAPSSKLQLKLLHVLPLTAVEKENIPTVLRTVNALFSSKQQILKNLSIEMYLILWKTEERCYSYFRDRLLDYKTRTAENNWEIDVILVSAVRNICAVKPEKYGKEWISVLNDVLKRWHKKKNGSVPSVLALDAILVLCKAQVLQVISVYQLLSAHLLDDKRVDVVVKFCSLVEYMFEITPKEDYDKLEEIFSQAVSKMWHIVSSSTDKEAIVAAMKALSKFDKDEMPLKIIPEVYRKHVKLPESVIKTSIDANKRPEDVLNNIPGEVWIVFLQNVRNDVKSEACDMLITWLRREVDNFPRSLYGSIRGEPKDLNFLHHKCIFKALVRYLMKFVKQGKQFDKNELPMSIICLKILNGNLNKTLPLLNWSFLLPLLEIEEFRVIEQVITLFARQSPTSFSARIAVENYLKNFKNFNEEKELKLIFNVLTDLCRGISTVVLKNFLEIARDCVINKLIDKDKTLLIFICDCFEKTLKNSEIEDNNRICVSECVEFFWENTSHDDEVFTNLINVAVELPSTYVEHLCSVRVMWETSADKICKLIKLRCAMALKSDEDDPFTWLQECVEAVILHLEEEELFFQHTSEIFKRHRSHSGSWLWVSQYMTYVYSILNELSDAKVRFVLNVFIFSIVNLSVYEPFVTFSWGEYSLFFPQALNSVVSDEFSTQVVEWLHNMIKSNKIDDTYRELFEKGILSMKNCKYFTNIAVWSKILS